jgi:uncharacterized protein YjiK
MLEKYDFDGDEIFKIKLPKDLKEISGLAYEGNNTVFTHNDEEGKVFKIDITTGKIINKFSVGEKKLKKDFEGIAIVDEIIYLSTSSGVLFKFKEPEFNVDVEYEKIKTGLKPENNVEGLCYDPATNSLLLACKGKAGKGFKKYRAVYSFNLDNLLLGEEPRFLISLNHLKNEYGIKEFSPSGIAIHPISYTLFIISADEETIIEITSDGKIMNAKHFNKKIHKQPEGITFLEDGSLVISDEAHGKEAKITIFPMH